MRFRKTVVGAVVGGVCAAVVVSGLPTIAIAAGSDPGAAASTAAQPADAVTLITGDRVTLVTGSDGKPAIAFEAAPRNDDRPVSYNSFGTEGHLFVIPSDVASLVPDQLDLNLFDVLALQELADNGSQDGIPVIVQKTAGPGARTAEPSWGALGVTPEETLESISSVAGETGPDGSPALVDAVETAETVEKVWLDAPVQMLDTDSMPQIGAPEAWAGGADGTGATVAVLDTGIDTTHPDLDGGIVTLEKDFTGSGTAMDQAGHGTHVASTIAGSGEASGGDYKGVAPGAHLLNGRVLNAAGQGETSWIIDAMEWAASNGADVINMSLGIQGEYTDGTDPGALAVNSISERYDTLVVIAAGNEGAFGASTVSTPGSADSALTVGAVTDDDSLAYFSSKGPRFGDFAIKPDITAPGNGIVAARAAADTNPQEPVGDFYQAMSGTSMATPHVAGAAAILKAARPDLDDQALKSVLMGSAQPTGNPVYSEGSGRVWIPGALDEAVYATPASLSFGVFSSPRDSQSPRTKTVTYTNTSSADAVVDVALTVTEADGDPAPADMVTLSADTVTVPAHGIASVDVTVDPHADEPGVYTGALTAGGPGFAPVRTVLAFTAEPDLHTLRIEATQSDGTQVPYGSSGMIYGIDDSQVNQSFSFVDGVAEVRLRPGRYALLGQLLGAVSPTAKFLDSFTSFTRDVDLQADTTIVLDGSQAIPVEIQTEKKAKVNNLDETIVRWLPNRSYPVTTTVTLGISPHDAGLDLDISVLGTEEPLAGDMTVNSRYVLNQPLLDVVATAGRHKVDISRELNYGVLSPQHLGTLSGAIVNAGSGSAEELAAAGARGAVVLVEDRGDPDLNAQAQAAYDAGAIAAIVYGAGPGPFFESVDPRRFLAMPPKALPTLTLPRDVGLKLVALIAEGKARLAGTGIAAPSYQYELGYIEEGMPTSLTYKANARSTAKVEVDVKAFAPGTRMVEYVTMIGGGTYTGFGLRYTGPLLGREVYYSTDEDLTFQRSVQAGEDWDVYPAPFESAPVTYRPGQKTSETWVGQVHHGGLLPSPSSPQDASVNRDRNVLAINLPYRVDGEGHPQQWGPDQESTGKFQVWTGDTLLTEGDTPHASLTVSAAKAAYRVTLNTHRDVPWWPLSTDVSTEWGFSSSSTKSATALPLLQLDYGVEGLNALNTNGRTTELNLYVSHQDRSAGGKVKGLKLWSSADDGATWTAVRVVPGREAGSYSAKLTAPRGATTISLRAEAWDDAGSTFKETVIDAYAVDTIAPPIEVTTPTAGAPQPTRSGAVAGTSEPSATVSVSAGRAECEATADADGAWACNLPVRDGVHRVEVTATDAVGNASEPVRRALWHDSTPPHAPKVTSPTGTVHSTRTAIKGSAEAGATVTVTEANRTVCTAVATSSWRWSCTPTDALTTGKHTLTVTATDAAGNVSSPRTHRFTITRE
ncbi:S8 family serine peptidase [Microbacterium sulfonylureivorans]|uniref:S8 family serine peptidase n=1 Tax=Microbacterium sulfonylureivorans TaxID=2486854 RepID=UPI0013E0A4B5|nr:S8 family serine peptidase [Microbacterium sulfonylureivorans]